jgi:hypothetical protein
MKPFFIFTTITALVGIADFARDSPANSYIPSGDPDELGKLPEGLELKCVLLRIGIHINTSTGDDNDTLVLHQSFCLTNCTRYHIPSL